MIREKPRNFQSVLSRDTRYTRKRGGTAYPSCLFVFRTASNICSANRSASSMVSKKNVIRCPIESVEKVSQVLEQTSCSPKIRWLLLVKFSRILLPFRGLSPTRTTIAGFRPCKFHFGHFSKTSRDTRRNKKCPRETSAKFRGGLRVQRDVRDPREDSPKFAAMPYRVSRDREFLIDFHAIDSFTRDGRQQEK